MACYSFLLTLLMVLWSYALHKEEKGWILSDANYREFCSSRSYKRNSHSDPLIIEEWRRVMGPPVKFHSNDSLFTNEDPYPIDYRVNWKVDVCKNNTFLLMMYPIRLKDYEMRQVLRRAVPQDIMVNNSRINRVFVIAIDDDDRESLRRIRNESRVFGDIIISRHPDAYSRIAKSVWDGLIWIREHCSQARFAGKFDPDAVVFLGNLVNYLRNAPTKRYYGGRKLSFSVRPRDERRIKFFYPLDYPYRRSVKFVSGPAALFSMDVVDHLVVGAEYEPLFIANSDDIMFGAILNRVGILPTQLRLRNCSFMVWVQDNHGYYYDYRRIPNGTCVYHYVKKVPLYNEIMEFFGDSLFRSNDCYCV